MTVTGMTSAVFSHKPSSRMPLKRRRAASPVETLLVLSGLGRPSRRRRSSDTTNSHMNTTLSTKTHPFNKLVRTGRRSGRRCIARYSRQRRRPGQKKAEDYSNAMRDSVIPPPTAITNIYINKMKTLDSDGQAALTFKMWDILEGRQSTPEDIIRTQLVCTPGAVPAYTKRGIITHDTANHHERCSYCHGRVDVIDDTDMPTCTECGVVTPPLLHFEASFLRGGRQGTENPHFTVVHKHIYDRMAHFKALLNNIQGLGRVSLCPKMLQALRDRVEEQYPCWPDHHWVIHNLKALKQGKYTPHAIRIAALINTRFSPPIVHEHQLNQLEIGFVEVCKHFDDWIQDNKNVKRKNFMSYPYIAHQLFRRNGLEHLCPFVQIIKSSVRLETQNQMWKAVCERGKFPFVSLTN